MQRNTQRVRAPLVLLLVALVGCGGTPPTKAPPAETEDVSNRISVSADVVSNLGITFREARLGRLETRIALPGRLVVPPDGRWDLRAPFGGTVRLSKRRGDSVQKGEVVAEIVSDELRTVQRSLWADEAELKSNELATTHAIVEYAGITKLAGIAKESLAAAKRRERRAQLLHGQAEDLERTTSARYQSLQKLTGEMIARKELVAAQQTWVEAQAQSLDAIERGDAARVSVLELEVKDANAAVRASTVSLALDSIRKRVVAARVAFEARLAYLASLSGISTSELLVESDGLPRWAQLSALPLVSPASGVIAQATAANGEWMSAGTRIVEIVNYDELLFEGHLPEVDAARAPAGTPVRVSFAVEGIEPVDTVVGRVYPVVSAVARTITIQARVPNPNGTIPTGATANASILLGSSKNEEVLVPTGCVVQDDLELVVFLQDRTDPEKVVRLPVAVGRRSAEWVEILTEVSAGDKVVENGIHELREAGSGKAPDGGHFHADGTWHAGDE